VTVGRPAGFRLPWVAFFGRTLAEYLCMFVVDIDELRVGTTLDCPSGPDSFVADARAAGCEVTGCDPMYSLAPEEILSRGRDNVDRCLAAIEAQPGALTFSDYDAFKRAKYDALLGFVADYARHREAYVPATLPALPFADHSFDRVLGANFLFAYASLADGGLYEGTEFDLEFHLRSIREIARVARHEIRLSPMGTFSPPPRPHPYREPAAELLRTLGFAVEFRPSEFDSGLAGFNDVLVASR
jgi:hypothetical protein